jgi:hypothetical protein
VILERQGLEEEKVGEKVDQLEQDIGRDVLNAPITIAMAVMRGR